MPIIRMVAMSLKSQSRKALPCSISGNATSRDDNQTNNVITQGEI